MPTLKPFRCSSETCQKRKLDSPESLIEYYESAREPCTFCGSEGTLYPLTEIHLLQPDEDGIIHGKDISGRPTGVRWEFCCEASRRGYRAGARSSSFPASFTGVPSAATCYECLMEYGRMKILHTHNSRKVLS